MFGLGELARWWEDKMAESTDALHQMVKEQAEDGQPDYFAVVVATAAETSMAWGAGFVDVLKLGEGVTEGGWGYAQDALRLLVVAGPAVRLGRMGLTRLATNVDGGICTWVSSSQALRQTGVKHFATVEDLAKAAGLRVSQLGGAHPIQVAPAMRQLGAIVDEVYGLSTLDDIARLARENPGDVIQFAVSWDTGAHALYMFRNALGRVTIADRSGTFVRSLAELEHMYKGISGAKIYPQATIVRRSAVVKYSPTASTLALEVRAVALRSEDDLDAVFEARKRALVPTVGFGPMTAEQIHVVARGDTLSAISRTYYGTSRRWRTIYEVNRDVIGSNPNVIHPGMRLTIPDVL